MSGKKSFVFFVSVLCFLGILVNLIHNRHLPPQKIIQEWGQWKENYRVRIDPAEELYRILIFQHNLQTI